MNKNIENFKKENPPLRVRRNVLFQIKDEIVELDNSGYTLEQIVQYIKTTYKIKTSRLTLGKVLKELKNADE